MDPYASLTRRNPRPILLTVDLVAVATLTAIFSGLTLALIRSVKKRRRRLLYLIPVGVAILVLRWAAYRQAWAELGLAVLLAGVVCAVWWLAYGRRLPPPTDDNIRVWTKDDPF
jgi:uncharacterized membrane protein